MATKLVYQEALNIFDERYIYDSLYSGSLDFIDFLFSILSANCTDSISKF